MESQLTRLQSIAEVVAVVQAVEGAKKRKDFPLRYGVTFFSKHDTWLYQAIMDDRLCPICDRHDDTAEFNGLHLRAKFPYLEIIDENTIKVHAHLPRDDNCRCVLVRKIG